MFSIYSSSSFLCYLIWKLCLYLRIVEDSVTTCLWNYWCWSIIFFRYRYYLSHFHLKKNYISAIHFVTIRDCVRLDLNGKEEEEVRESLATMAVSALLEEAQKQAAFIRQSMLKRFDQLFRNDESGLPRKWQDEKNIREIYLKARDQVCCWDCFRIFLVMFSRFFCLIYEFSWLVFGCKLTCVLAILRQLANWLDCCCHRPWHCWICSRNFALLSMRRTQMILPLVWIIFKSWISKGMFFIL